MWFVLLTYSQMVSPASYMIKQMTSYHSVNILSLATLAFLIIYVLIAVLQHPESQHVVVGSNATFSCRFRYSQSHIRWEEIFPNGMTKAQLTQDGGTGVYIHEISTSVQQQYNSTLTIVITCSNEPMWNGAMLRCYALTGSGSQPSNSATLAIYKSLSKCYYSSTHTSHANEHNNYYNINLVHAMQVIVYLLKLAAVFCPL